MRAFAFAWIVAAACAHRHPYAYNFVPFGAGQLENGEPTKALAFALAEAAAGGTSLAIYVHLGREYPRGVVPADDALHVRHLQQIEIGTGAAFFAVATWGVIDAVLHWHPPVELAPAPISDGGGLAISGHF